VKSNVAPGQAHKFIGGNSYQMLVENIFTRRFLTERLSHPHKSWIFFPWS
jgi:hypothetical protein